MCVVSFTLRSHYHFGKWFHLLEGRLLACRAHRITTTVMRSSLFWTVTQSQLVVGYRRFGTTYHFHLQWSSSPRIALGSLILEDGTDQSSWNIRNWTVTQSQLVVGYRRFGTTYLFHLQWSSSPSIALGSLILEDGTDMSSWNIRNWTVTQSQLVVGYRRFGTTYHFHLQWSSSPRIALGSLILEDGTDMSSWNIRNKLPDDSV
jgi:hypothetical protein